MGARSRPRGRLGAGGLLALLALACADGGGAGAEPRNLLLVTVDTLRADRLGSYGWDAAVTPTLDRLADEGVQFQTCIAVAPVTLPSHASILTGRYPFRHGARNNGTHRLPEASATLAELLAERGLTTGAVVSAFVLDGRYGLDQGFATYDDDVGGSGDSVVHESKAGRTTDRALRWLAEREPGERWFLWVHYFDPHAPYEAPAAFAERCPGSAYDAEIAFVDAELGRLVGALEGRGELERTLVAVTSDHGEALGEHGEATHGIFVYDATTRVPLVLRHPSLPAARRVPGVCSSVDLLPTVCELFDLAVPPGVDGRSLVPAARGAPLEGRTAYSEAMAPWFNHGWSDLRAVRDRTARYVRAPRPELYDLEADPGERVDVSARRPERAAELAARLAALLPEDEADSRGEGAARMSEADRAALAELGYVFTGAPDESGELPDPKDRIAILEESFVAQSLVREGRLEDAERALRAVIAVEPRLLTARNALVDVLVRTDRKEEAIDVLRGTLAAPGVRMGTFLRLAELERDLGRDWERSLELAKGFDPADPAPFLREARWREEGGDVEGALAAYRGALEVEPESVDALLGIGATELARGARDRAEAAFRRAAELAPGDFRVQTDLGVFLMRAGRPRPAADALALAARLEPGRAEAWSRLMVARSAGGDAAGALEAARRLLELRPGDLQGSVIAASSLLDLGRRAEAADELRGALAAHGARVLELTRRDPRLAALVDEIRR